MLVWPVRTSFYEFSELHKVNTLEVICLCVLSVLIIGGETLCWGGH